MNVFGNNILEYFHAKYPQYFDVNDEEYYSVKMDCIPDEHSDNAIMTDFYYKIFYCIIQTRKLLKGLDPCFSFCFFDSI